jgi:hypothetical protein
LNSPIQRHAIARALSISHAEKLVVVFKLCDYKDEEQFFRQPKKVVILNPTWLLSILSSIKQKK